MYTVIGMLKDLDNSAPIAEMARLLRLIRVMSPNIVIKSKILKDKREVCK